jgi:parallel beta-helix repeat protein
MNRLLKTRLVLIFCCLICNYAKATDCINYEGVLTPFEYGARPNDNLDDSNAFQCCLDEAQKRVGTKIIIPPGRYIIAKQLNINNTISLLIEGDGAVLVKPSGNGSNIFYGNYNKQITIQNLIFDGNRLPDFKEKWPEKMNACVIIGRSCGIRFKNCVVRNFYYGVCLGTSTDNGYDVWVVDCQFENCQSDIDLYGKPSVHIVGNSSHNCAGHSIQIEPPYKRKEGISDYRKQPRFEALSVGNIISNNVIEGCKGVGIILFEGCENITVSNNQIINFGQTGIMTHDGASNVLISNNIVSNSLRSNKNDRPWTSLGAGILLADVQNAVVTSNVIYHANTGIYVSNNEGAIVSFNKISDSKDAGICLIKSKYCSLDGNHYSNYNLDKKWWANSGVVIYLSSDISISNSIFTDRLNNDYAIVSMESERVNISNSAAQGYKKSLSSSINLAK